jgi:hypothetical protein
MTFSVTFENETYDIERFLDTHPGGHAILVPYKDRDITTAFRDIGHSQSARRLLQKYHTVEERAHVNETETRNSLREHVLKKLFTNEDPFYIHKSLGAIALVNFVARYLLCFPLCFNLGYGADVLSLATLLIHGLLSSSSIFFHVLTSRMVKNPMVIYEEYRIHTIIFTWRGVVVSMLGMYLEAHALPQNVARILLGVTMLSFHVAADLATKRYGTPGVTTIRVDAPNHLVTTKRFFAFAQFVAIGGMLVPHERLADLGFNTLAGIQSSAFLMTLRRKGFIKWRSYALWYSLSLLAAVFYTAYARGICFVGLIFMVFLLRVKCHISKYVLWTFFALVAPYTAELLANPAHGMR